MPTNVSMERRKRAGQALQSYHCVCGKKKPPMMVACNACWQKLSHTMRCDLRNMLKGKFVICFEKAQALLTPAPVITDHAPEPTPEPEIVGQPI